MHCRLMEVQSACCADPSNCPEGDPTPHECPVGCALVFPFFLESCHDALAEQGGDMDEYAKFSDACARQDTTALVEYAVSLKNDGCTIDLGDGRGRRMESSESAFDDAFAPGGVGQGYEYDAADDDSAGIQDSSTSVTRRLQAGGACDGFADDPNGDLVAHGVTCEQVVGLGCDADVHALQPELPEGSLISVMCPVSCNACQRTGMAKWIEAPEDCKWSTIDGKPSAGFSVRAGGWPTYVRCRRMQIVSSRSTKSAVEPKTPMLFVRAALPRVTALRCAPSPSTPWRATAAGLCRA